MNKLLLVVILGVLLVGCSGEQTSPPDQEPNQSEEERIPIEEKEIEDNENEEPQNAPNPLEKDKVDIQTYFPPQNVKKYFKGQGNEYATEEETIYTLEGEYFASTVDNGGTRILKIYKLTEEGIFLVYEQPEFYEEEIPSINALKSNLNTEKPILTLPLEKGQTIGEWRVVEVNGNITIPIGELSHVVVLEQIHESGSVTRQFWAPQYGLVKKEFYYEEAGVETIVTSELERVEKYAQ